MEPASYQYDMTFARDPSAGETLEGMWGGTPPLKIIFPKSEFVIQFSAKKK